MKKYKRLALHLIIPLGKICFDNLHWQSTKNDCHYLLYWRNFTLGTTELKRFL